MFLIFASDMACGESDIFISVASAFPLSKQTISELDQIYCNPTTPAKGKQTQSITKKKRQSDA
jgi:hypothetical protein